MNKLGYVLALSLLLAVYVNDGESDDTAKTTKSLSEKESIHMQEEAIQDSMDEVQKEVESDKSNEVSDTFPENKDIIEEPAEQVERADDTDETNTGSGISESSKETVSEVKTNISSEKDKYLNKMVNVKASISEFEKQLESGTQVEMGQAYEEIFKRWDQEMNDIYGVLKNQLPVSEMNKLREEQRNWLIYRDETAKEASAKYEEGTMASLEYVATQTILTEERSYELVETYMY